MCKIKYLFLAGVALAMFTAPVKAAEEIRLGVAVSLTGDIASYGIPSKNAAEIIAEQINAKGGIDGRKVVVIAQDDQCKPELATHAVTKLVSDKAHVVLGHICSGAHKAALPIYNSSKLISMSPAATTPSLSTSGENPYFFRTIANDNVQAKLSAVFVADKLKVKKIALIHDNGEYGKGYIETNKAFLDKGGKVEIVLLDSVNPDAVDYSSIVKKIKRAKPDVVIFGGYHPTASKLIKQMRRDRISVPFVGPDSIKTDAFIQMAGAESDGVYASSPSDTSNLPIHKVAYDQHVKKFNAEPGPFYYTGYAAVMALLNAIDKADSTDSDKIAAALRSETIDTPAGSITFSKTGDPIGVGLSMYQVKNGKFVETDSKILID